MDNPTLFVVILRYLVPLEIILEQREEHLKFLDIYYAKGIFHASGPQIPRTGGIILANASSREELQKILEDDPYYKYKSAEYQIFELTVNKKSQAFNTFVESIACVFTSGFK